MGNGFLRPDINPGRNQQPSPSRDRTSSIRLRCPEHLPDSVMPCCNNTVFFSIIGTPHLFAIILFLAGLLVCAADNSVARELPPGTSGQAAAPVFDILEYRIDGNSVLPALTVERAVYPHLGPGLGMEDVEEARKSLERAYHETGYLTVRIDIPEQKIEDGVVILRVLEGKVEKLRISGNRYYSRGEIRSGTPSLTEDTVPNFPEIQSELSQLSRSPDRQVTPLLRPGKIPGMVEVELKVNDKFPLHGGVDINSKESPGTTRGRLEASIRYDNLWQRQHSVGMNYIVTPRNREEIEVFVGSYSLPLDRRGSSLTVYGVRSNSNVATALDSSVIGKGSTIGMRVATPLPARGAYTHSASLGIDYKNFEQTVALLGLDSTTLPIHYFPLAAQYTGLLQDSTGSWQFGTGMTWSLRGLADRDVDCNGVVIDQFACRRFGARPNFIIVRADLQRTQSLPAGWSLFARADGQFASQPLISNEQLLAGGFDTVRGYLEAERLADDGARGRVELRTPAFGGGDNPLLKYIPRTYGLLFYDAAWLRIQEPLPLQENAFLLHSTGFGLRTNQGGWRFILNLARAMSSGSRTQQGDIRLDMGLGYHF